ncbi:hypothetical protein CMU00_08850 [Elizabethkingia anophelis]|nr:hypothetical protein [Elizabethkingia anophelis]
MKKLIWFTHTNIDTRQESPINIDGNKFPKHFINLTQYLDIFKKNKIWERKKYRTEYITNYSLEDLNKITSIKINLHSEAAPYSNGHSYESVIKQYIDISNIEISKITSSSIGEASQIAIIEAEFSSEFKIIDYLTHDEEKSFINIFEKRLSQENIKSWKETEKIKSIIIEFLQFYIFNLHLNFLTKEYHFSFTNKPIQTGFIVLSDSKSLYFESDKIDFLSHYILYESSKDSLIEIMNKTSKFWHKEVPTFHFFLDALKGSHMTINNFSKLVYCIESFFSPRTSNDFMTLTIPLLIGKDIHSMKEIREILRRSFDIRNNYVHGGEIIDLYSNVNSKDNTQVYDIFYELKNIIIKILFYYINNNLYLSRINEKINHEMLFNKFKTISKH